MSLSVTNARLDGEHAGVRVVDGTIVGVGPKVEPDPDDEVIDAGGMALVPPLVNGHTHAAMTLFRSYGDDLPLMEWLQTRIWPAEAKLDRSDVYWGTRLACIEMIRSGTTRFFDMYWHGDAVANAATDSGLRCVPSGVVIDGLDPVRAREVQPEVRETLETLMEFGNDLIEPSLGPHGVYTVSPGTLAFIADLAREFDVPVHIHLAESEDEVQNCVEANGCKPAELLDRVGLLGPKSLLAHGNWLSDSELELIADRGATIVTPPTSNLKLTYGCTFPLLRAMEIGVSVGLGTDGAASNNNLDLFEEVKFLALLHKHEAGDASVLPAPAALEIAHGWQSDLLGGPHLEVGAPADFLLVNTRVPEMAPGDLKANLVYAASGSVVDTTVVAGNVVMRHREVEGIEEAISEVQQRAARLTGQA